MKPDGDTGLDTVFLKPGSSLEMPQRSCIFYAYSKLHQPGVGLIGRMIADSKERCKNAFN